MHAVVYLEEDRRRAELLRSEFVAPASNTAHPLTLEPCLSRIAAYWVRPNRAAGQSRPLENLGFTHELRRRLFAGEVAL